MTTLILTVISFICVIYGALIFKRYHTPFSAKVTVKEECIDDWCRTEAITRMLLGIDVAFLAMYTIGGPYAKLALLAFAAMMLYISVIRYKNNQKYFKNR